jgi:OmpA family protein
MKRFGLVGITTWAFLSLFDAPKVAAQQITVNVKQEGQAAPGVSVVFLAANVIKPAAAPANNADKSALNLGNIIKPRVAVTDASGTGVLDLSNIIKPHGQVEVQIVVRICKDGKNAVYVLQKGQEVPPQDKKCVDSKDCECKDRPVAGFFLIGDGDTLNVGINPETIDVQVTHASVGGGPSQRTRSQNPLISVQVGGGVGFKQFTSVNTCQTILVVFPSATCNSGNKSAGFNIEGALGFTRYLAASATAGWFAAIQRTATAATLNEKSSFGPQVQTLTGQVILPIGPVSLFGEGGGAFWQINMKETQGPGSSGTSNSVTSNLHVSGNSAVEGAGVRLKIWPRVAVQVHYQHFQAQKSNVFSEHNNVVLFGVLVRLR